MRKQTEEAQAEGKEREPYWFTENELCHAQVDYSDLGWGDAECGWQSADDHLDAYKTSLKAMSDLMWIDGAYRDKKIQKRRLYMDPFATMAIFKKTIRTFHHEVQNETDLGSQLDNEETESQMDHLYENKEVVDFYNKGGVKNAQLDEEMKPLKLTEQDVADLVIFMKEGLKSAKYPHVDPPELP